MTERRGSTCCCGLLAPSQGGGRGLMQLCPGCKVQVSGSRPKVPSTARKPIPHTLPWTDGFEFRELERRWRRFLADGLRGAGIQPWTWAANFLQELRAIAVLQTRTASHHAQILDQTKRVDSIVQDEVASWCVRVLVHEECREFPGFHSHIFAGDFVRATTQQYGLQLLGQCCAGYMSATQNCCAGCSTSRAASTCSQLRHPTPVQQPQPCWATARVRSA